jgi:hypothetical protein
MIPVEVFRLRPGGMAGVTEYESTAPPLLLGELAVIAVPTTYAAGLLEYLRLLGGAPGVGSGELLPPHPRAKAASSAAVARR